MDGPGVSNYYTIVTGEFLYPGEPSWKVKLRADNACISIGDAQLGTTMAPSSADIISKRPIAVCVDAMVTTSDGTSFGFDGLPVVLKSGAILKLSPGGSEVGDEDERYRKLAGTVTLELDSTMKSAA